MRIIVLGTGYVASAYLAACHSLGIRPVVLSRTWSDYTNTNNLNWVCEGVKPDLIINAAGYTGRTVDDCESNKEVCYAANVSAVRVLGEVCKARDISLIHVSSGCVFNGLGPFKETDTPNNYGQFYAQCKIAAEQELTDIGARAWIYRIRMPFDTRNHARNWLYKLCAHAKILDGLNSITYLSEFAIRSLDLVKEKKGDPGLYHCANRGAIRTADVAQMLYDAKLRERPVELWKRHDFIDTHVLRSEAVLDSTKFEDAYRTPFGPTDSWVKWAIANWTWQDQFGNAKPIFRFTPDTISPWEPF